MFTTHHRVNEALGHINDPGDRTLKPSYILIPILVQILCQINEVVVLFHTRNN